MTKKKRVVLGVTGSIAAYKTADIVRRLLKEDLKVSVVMTQSAERFITPLTLSSLSGERVYTEMFRRGDDDLDIQHISLGQAADLILIAPATANIIAKLAGGLANDLLSCTCLSTKAPVLIVPAMNPVMYGNKIVQENCAKLKEFGMKFIGPIEGKVACGDVGLGHIALVEDIVKEVISSMK